MHSVADAWHWLGPRERVTYLLEVLEFLVDRIVPGMSRIPVWVGRGLVAMVPCSSDELCMWGSSCDSDVLDSVCPQITR